MRLTKRQADEIRYRLDVVAGEPDLLEDYGLTAEQVEAVYDTVPVRGEWEIPAYALDMVREEVGVIVDQISDHGDFECKGIYLTQAEEDERTVRVRKIRREARGFAALLKG